MYKYPSTYSIFSTHNGNMTYNIVNTEGQIVAVVNASPSDDIQSLRAVFLENDNEEE